MPYLDWEKRRKPDGKLLFVCLPCQDHRERQIHHLKDHEKTAKHIAALANFDNSEQLEMSNVGSSSSHPPVINKPDALQALLMSALENPSQHWQDDDYHPVIPRSQSPPDHSASWQGPNLPVAGINWDLLEATETTTLEDFPLQEYIQSVSQASLDFINGDLSEDELLERTSVCSDSSHAPQGLPLSFLFHFAICSINYLSGLDFSEDEVQDEPSAAKRPRNYATDPNTAREWFPWPDRIVILLFFSVTKL